MSRRLGNAHDTYRPGTSHTVVPRGVSPTYIFDEDEHTVIRAIGGSHTLHLALDKIFDLRAGRFFVCVMYKNYSTFLDR